MNYPIPEKYQLIDNIKYMFVPQYKHVFELESNLRPYQIQFLNSLDRVAVMVNAEKGTVEINRQVFNEMQADIKALQIYHELPFMSPVKVIRPKSKIIFDLPKPTDITLSFYPKVKPQKKSFFDKIKAFFIK